MVAVFALILILFLYILARSTVTKKGRNIFLAVIWWLFISNVIKDNLHNLFDPMTIGLTMIGVIIMLFITLVTFMSYNYMQKEDK